MKKLKLDVAKAMSREEMKKIGGGDWCHVLTECRLYSAGTVYTGYCRGALLSSDDCFCYVTEGGETIVSNQSVVSEACFN